MDKTSQKSTRILRRKLISKVDEIIAQYRNKPGSLIPVLEETQGVVGYLPVELQEYISRGLNVPASTVYGVVTFYSFFTMVPKGRHTIKVCMGTACYVKGIGEVLNRAPGSVQIGAWKDVRGQAVFPGGGPMPRRVWPGAGRGR